MAIRITLAEAGRCMAEDGTLSRLANWRSVVAASVSQLGYGGSSGPDRLLPRIWCTILKLKAASP